MAIRGRPATTGPRPDPLPSGSVTQVPGGGGYRGLLANRNFRLFFLSSVQSSLGDWAGLVALQTLVLVLAQGTRLALFSLGAVMMARLVPSLFIGPVAGVLADRYDRKRLMVVCDLARGLLFLGIAFTDEIVGLLALSFIVECLALLFAAAKDAALPSLVDRSQLEQANQLNLLATYGTLPLGAVLAAVMAGLSRLFAGTGLEEVDPVRVVLVVNALTYLVGAALFTALRLPPRAQRAGAQQTEGVIAELRAGFEFIRDRPLIRSLITGVVGVFFGAGVVVTIGPEFVRTELGRPTTDWSILMTSVGAGLVLGIGGVRLLTRGEDGLAPERLFPWALGATGAIATVIATLPSFTATLVAGCALGAVAGMAFVTGYTLLQVSTPDEVRARTFATFYTGTRTALFAALAIAPFLAGAIGRGTIIVGGFRLSMSGTRIALLLGGLIGLSAAVYAGRGMLRGVRREGVRPAVRLAAEPGPVPLTGVFVAFEGGEGTGKSTQVRALAAALEAEGREVVVTREPGGAPVAERIRELVLDPGNAMDPRTEALLYAAARAEHVRKVVLPALEAGRIVVCDRYLDSSLVYQGRGRGLGERDVFEINRWAIEDVIPDVVVVLHLDPEEGLRRIADRSRRAGATPLRDGDRIEREDLVFHRRVAEAYLDLAAGDPSRYVVVDAGADQETVARQVRSGLHPWLPLVSRDDQADAGRADSGRADSGRAGRAG